jgi:hypothetical protein
MREYEALLQRRDSGQEFKLYNAAAIVCAIYNVNRDTKRHPDPFTPEEFLGKKKIPKQQTPEQMLEMVKALHAAFGGRPPVEA